MPSFVRFALVQLRRTERGSAARLYIEKIKLAQAQRDEPLVRFVPVRQQEPERMSQR
jgi:hypothetical protein